MAIKQLDLKRNQTVPTGAGYTFDPALVTNVGGVETLTAPDLVIAVPKAAACSSAVTTALAVGNQTVVHQDGGDKVFDILSIAFHTIQKVVSGDNKQASISLATSLAAAGTAIDPLLKQGGVLVAPDIAICVPKVVPTLNKMPYVPTVMATGNITCHSGEVVAVNNDVCMIRMHTIQRLIAMVFGMSQVRTRYFTVLDTADAGLGSIFKDAADPTRIFEVTRAKVSGDGSLELRCIQTSGTTGPAATGNLNLYEGTGDAVVAWTAVLYEKYADLQSNVAVANGAGLTFTPGLIVNGTKVMPDIVIPIPKAVDIVPYVPTDLTGAAGPVNVRINGGAPANCDILSLKVVTGFRNVNSAP